MYSRFVAGAVGAGAAAVGQVLPQAERNFVVTGVEKVDEAAGATWPLGRTAAVREGPDHIQLDGLGHRDQKEARHCEYYPIHV